MLDEMREHDEGFFHHAQRMSKHHCQYYKNLPLSESKVQFFEDMAKQSLAKQKMIEAEDSISFDEFLKEYFKQG